jgi:hypothetical protein
MNQTEQLELGQTAAPRHAADADVAWLENLLQGAKCWMSAKDICLTVVGRLGDRDIRALASETNRVISGQKGYKHIENATPEEIAHSANWLISQGKKMIKRGIGQRRAAHGRIG